MPSQTDRIAAALKAHPNGITQADWTGPHTIDNGPPILRLAARILDLKAKGFPIVDAGERQGCKVYKWDRERYLAEKSQAVEAEHQVSMDVDESDFEPIKDTRERVTADGLRIYDPRSEWA